ncbi:NAD(P)-binding domain-containing protein [Chitinophaga horti]|uniref:NAD(P)-binding domain-containing protein n=1 Tax=Chitinophaga horti TaxID=2920382 RepID=A0ABY6J0T3_9BACT|nr:NAD(P)-dependent oxidoreductase [Chitinophaga horti]UYQ93273.1 NAD(P)-binding domain-containing protein [Chitinophaga horti]
MKQVLITAKVNPYLINELEQKGYTVIYQPAVTYDEVTAQIGQVDGMIVTTRIKVDKAMLDKASRLQWIGRLGSGMELIDVPYAESKGIKCVSSPEGNADTVGEQVVGMLICLLHNLLKSNLELREGIWERDGNRAWELGGRTVGIIGYGHTGSAVAKRLRGFGVNIIAYDKYKKNYGTSEVKEVSLQEIFEQAEIVTTHLPLTEETRHMVNAEFFRSFANPIYYINASRGKVADTRALADALETGLVKGACLDVLENEKLSTYTEEEKILFNRLLRNPNVVMTPHIAGYSHEATIKMAKIVLQKLDI